MKTRPPVEMKVSSNALVFTALLLLCIFYLVSQQGLRPAKFNTRKFLRHTTPRITPVEWQLEKPGEGLVSSVRAMHGFGTAAFSFVLGSAYRTNNSAFAVVGLASKPLQDYGKASYSCEWRPYNGGRVHKVSATHLLPDWGYGRVYTVVVVHCNFGKVEVGVNSAGGELVLHVLGGGGSTEGDEDIEVPALREAPGEYKPQVSLRPYKYEYLYCGSSLYGSVDPRRLREWLAYHNWFLGPNSHFVLYDADGSLISSEALREVVEPWVTLGKVTIHDYRVQQLFDGYYYNQFMVVNDCFFRHKNDAKWMFFFDVDEYLNLPGPETLEQVLDDLGKNFTQIMFEQNLMGHNICLSGNDLSSQWGFEKLAFKNVEKKYRQDRKYVIKPKLADSAGVHLSQHIQGRSLYLSGRLNYYHYHNTINEHGENCKQVHNRPRRPRRDKIIIGGTPYMVDEALSSKASIVKTFERQMLKIARHQQQKH